MKSNDTYMVYSTFENRAEALSVARALLEKRLVACVNIYDNVTSMYRWEGALQQSQEAVLTAKTSADKRQAAMDEIKRLHSYDLPCIIAYAITDGLPEFLDWIANETA